MIGGDINCPPEQPGWPGVPAPESWSGVVCGGLPGGVSDDRGEWR
ncbi:hypothetical protein [Streptomyces sp. NPDC126933]